MKVSSNKPKFHLQEFIEIGLNDRHRESFQPCNLTDLVDFWWNESTNPINELNTCLEQSLES